jgi:phage gpG-like protein
VAIVKSGKILSAPAMLDRVVFELRSTTFPRILTKVGTDHREAYRVGGHQNHGGEAWAPLAPSTVAYKKKRRFPPNILVRTGLMGLTTRSFAATQRQGPTSFTYRIGVKTSAPYANIHQDPNGWTHHMTGAKIPSRPPLDITSEDVGWVAQQIRAVIASFR